ncbi:MAG: hypothetical protein ACR2N6_00400 [Miltoncostaeaceae bacterium]
MSTALRPQHALALQTLAATLDDTLAEWLLAGSTARRIAGWDVEPDDIDVEVSPHGIEAAADACDLTLRDDDIGSGHSLRAEGEISGVAIDLTANLEVAGPGGHLGPDFPLQRTWSTSVEVGGRRIWLAPVEEGLARAMVTGDWAKVVALGTGAPADTPIRVPYLSLRLASAARAAR